MIVKCEQCQTRFRIPDEKVTEKGVKVRCTKCQNTFRVTRPAAAAGVPVQSPAPAPVAAAPDFDPFASFGPPPPQPAESQLFDLPPPAKSATPSYGTPRAPARALPPPPPPASLNSTDLNGAAPVDDFFGDMNGVDSAAFEAAANSLPTGGRLPSAPSAPSIRAASTAMLGEFEPSPDFTPGQGDRGLFDIPPPPPQTEPEPPPHVFEPALATDSPKRVPTAVARPMGRPEDARGLVERKHVGPAQQASGIIVNIAVASALMLVLVTVGSVYLNEGKLDASSISLSRIKQLMWPAHEVVALDVSNGLYETQHGRPVFYVRGDVENRGARAGRVKVRAEILDGSQLVRAAEGWAGKAPTPEELYSVSSASDVEAMGTRLDKEAVQLRTGGRAPFVLVFYEYPPDLTGFRLRISVLEGDAGKTAVR